MSEGRRRRYRKAKDDREKDYQRHVILAKRDDDTRNAETVAEVKPKILLKSKTDKESETASSSNTNSTAAAAHAPQKTIIVTRSEHAQSPAISVNTSPNPTTQRDVDALAQNMATVQLVEPVAKMTRPTTIISSTGHVNVNAKKLLLKQNTEFLVVGVIGTQGVGKSSIMNLLANEETNYDYYEHIFAHDDSIFRTRIKANKCLSRSGTESVHMFINSDRVIFLDTPPVLSNPYKKDMTSSELDDLNLIMGLYSVCHLLLVVQDDYVNLNFLRLLRFAELMKPQTQEDKNFTSGYLPHILFIKNRAKRTDFLQYQKQQFEHLISACFNDSQLNIFRNATTITSSVFSGTALAAQKPTDALLSKQKRTRSSIEQEKTSLNTILLPDVEDVNEGTQLQLLDAVKKLRRRVFMTSRSQMYNAAELYTETLWFDMLSKVWQESQYFLLNTYENLHRRVYDVCVFNGVNSSSSSNNGILHSTYSKDINDWKD